MIENAISTTSDIVQDNSNVTPEANPMDTVQTETRNLVSVTPLFDFNAEHNGKTCM